MLTVSTAYAVTHETFRDVVDLLIPELQNAASLSRSIAKAPCAKTVRRRAASGRAASGAGYRRGARIDVAAGEKVT